jgi:hypothetical protein
MLFAATVLIQIAVAVLAVRAVRGDIAFYLVAWVSVLGLLTWIVLAAGLSTFVHAAPRPFLRAAMVITSVVLVGLALRVSAPRPAVFRAPDPAAESLARDVDAFLRSAAPARPMVRIGARDVWPTAAAVVLHLYKRRVPIGIEPSWEFLFGSQLASGSGSPPALIFHNAAQTQPGLLLVGERGGVYVYWNPTG